MSNAEGFMLVLAPLTGGGHGDNFSDDVMVI